MEKDREEKGPHEGSDKVESKRIYKHKLLERARKPEQEKGNKCDQLLDELYPII